MTGLPGEPVSVAASKTRSPHPALRGLVGDYAGYWYRADPPSVHHGLPGTTLTMVLAFGKPLDVGWLGVPGTRGSHWAMVSGLGVDPAAVFQDGVEQGIQVEVTALGARVLFGLPAAALRHEIVSIGSLPAGGRLDGLPGRVADESSWAARFDVLDRLLLRRLESADPSACGIDPGLRHAWHLLHRSGGAMRVSALADEVGWSRRRLHERFEAEFGVSPKQASRLVRFGAARELLMRGDSRLSEVAYRCGYADQAHLSREWRTLAGVSPIHWLAEVRSIVQDAERAGAAESPS